MTRPLAPAAIPLAAWSDLAALKRLRAERSGLTGPLLRPRSAKSLLRAEKLCQITCEILQHELRLARLGIDPVAGPDLPAPARPHIETED